jgi:formate dehydrogenase maturation protein FdhE
LAQSAKPRLAFSRLHGTGMGAMTNKASKKMKKDLENVLEKVRNMTQEEIEAASQRMLDFELQLEKNKRDD